MKILLFVILGFVLADADDTSALTDMSDDWIHLGTRKVDYKVDRDHIPITLTEGRFSALKFTVVDGDINLRKCVITFGDESKQTVTLRKRIKEGSSSRKINLRGAKRIIKHVEFVYDMKGIKGKKAKLKLYGLK